MSWTISHGLVDLSHWIGMAGAVAGYLNHWLETGLRPTLQPLGQLAAAKRFFLSVIQGAELSQEEPLQSEDSMMFDISNLAIMIEVMEMPAVLPQKLIGKFDIVDTARSYLKCVEAALDLSSIPDTNTMKCLKVFLERLWRKGNLAINSYNCD
jgi:hypothetical protein